jgi:DNA-binding transcriptional ArsR family regulator
MAKNNLAIAKKSDDELEDAPKPQRAFKVEKAAENVSNELDKNLLNTTDGNISVHARKLEEANYLTCEKSFKGRVPLTEYRITDVGREALNRYLNHMEALINAMKGK